MAIDGVGYTSKSNNAKSHGEAVQDTINRATLQEHWDIIVFL